MPRKTRQQKILTELRTLRNQLQTPEKAETSTSNQTRNSISTEKLSSLMQTPVIASRVTNTADYRYIASDLRKVAVLATIAFLVEIVLSLTVNLGFVKLL